MDAASESRIDEIFAAQSNLPTFLQRSRETIAADEEAQALRRASFTRAKLTDAERAVSQGRTLEEIALANLATEGADVELEQIRLAQGLELQGKFTEAADTHPHEEEKARLAAIEEAVNKDDSEVCDCPSEVVDIKGEQIEVFPQYEVKKIYSPKHHGVVSLVGCRGCPDLNATPTPPSQLQAILNAQKARKVTVSDVQLLKVNK